MDRFTVIKNGLVLSLDRKGMTGYFNIIIRSGKIFIIDYENKFNEKEFRIKNPDAEIIDAGNKLIMPGLFNSKSVSSYSLNKLFFRRCNYENISSSLSLNLIDKYLSNKENFHTLKDILKISYSKSLLNGEVFINESSISVKKDFFTAHLADTDWIKQYYNLTVYDLSVLEDLNVSNNFLSPGFKTNEDINTYSLSSLKKSLSGSNMRLFIDASLSQKTFDSMKKVFGKSFISVLDDMDLISGGTVISNPVNINYGEIEILKKKKANVLISPSDYINMVDRNIDFDELIFSGLNIITGTGYTGNDILSELKFLTLLLSSRNFSYENILRTAVLNPSVLFGISNVTGSIERNKSADFIMFNLTDVRNTMTLPYTDSESISEFILRNLSSKDISSVMLKGEILVEEKKLKQAVPETGQSNIKDISAKIYSAGKYFEFREKYLMRGRVDKLGLDSSQDEPEKIEKEEIFVDMVETGEYVGEGEFTILRTKEEEFEKPRHRDEEKNIIINLREIKSLENDMNLFEGLEESQQILKPKIKKRDKPSAAKTGDSPDKEEKKLKQESYDEAGVKTEKQLTDEIVFPGEGAEEIPAEEPVKPEFKTTKLKFGFKDDE